MSAAPRRRSKPRRDAGRPRGAPIHEAVLEATLAELATHGIAGLSVDRIARAAEVNKTSVYRRWPTRESLVAAALLRVLEDVSLELVDTGTLRGDLRIVAETVARVLEQPVGQALVRAAFASSEASELVLLATRRLQNQAVDPVREMVKRAQARGEWQREVSPETLLGALVGAILHRAMLERRATTKAWLASLVELLVVGVAPRSSGD